MTIEPIIEDQNIRLVVIIFAYVFTVAFSGVVVRFFVLPRNVKLIDEPEDVDAKPDPQKPRFDSSVVIGKCENLITVTFVLVGQGTGLALIFAAKSLVRSSDIKTNPGFFLGGTLVNLVWGLGIASAARLLISGMP